MLSGTEGDRNTKQPKLAIQSFGFIFSLVETEHIIQYSLPLIVIVDAASEARRYRVASVVWRYT